MKKSILILSTLSLASALPANITGFSTNFNGDASSYTDNFRRANDDVVGTTGLDWSATGGTANSGSLVVSETAARNIFYRPSPPSNSTSVFNLNALSVGSTYTSTTDFLWNDTASTSLTVVTNGFTTSNASQNSLTSSGTLAGSIIRNDSSTVTLRMRAGNANATTLDFSQNTLTAGNWYQLQYTLEKTNTADTFAYSVSLYSIGNDGTATPTLFNDGSNDITISGTATSSLLYSDEDVFFAYDIRGGSTGISNVDNFTVAVPEASTFALFAGFASLASMMIRRRIHA